MNENTISNNTKKFRLFFKGYVFDPNEFLRSNKSISSPLIPNSMFVFNKFDNPLT